MKSALQLMMAWTLYWTLRTDACFLDAVDWFAELVWEWTGVSRQQLRHGSNTLWALIAIEQCLADHSWIMLVMVGITFLLNLFRAPHPHPILGFLGRTAINLWWLAVAILSIRNWHGWASIFNLLGFTAFWLYVYLLCERPRPRKRERRILLDELKKLFGLDWMPELVKVEN